MGKTLSEMANIYLATYKLGDKGAMLHHDAIHAMTGLGIGIADEMRVIGVEVALRDSYNCDSGWTAIQKAGKIYDAVMWTLEAGQPDFRMYNGIECEKFQQIQCGTVLLAHEEFDEYFVLGRKIFAAIKALTGKRYMAVPKEELGAIDISKLDFSAEARAIKQKYMKPENKKTGTLTARHLRAAARAQQHPLRIPRTDKSWTLNAGM